MASLYSYLYHKVAGDLGSNFCNDSYFRTVPHLVSGTINYITPFPSFQEISSSVLLASQFRYIPFDNRIKQAFADTAAILSLFSIPDKCRTFFNPDFLQSQTITKTTHLGPVLLLKFKQLVEVVKTTGAVALYALQNTDFWTVSKAVYKKMEYVLLTATVLSSLYDLSEGVYHCSHIRENTCKGHTGMAIIQIFRAVATLGLVTLTALDKYSILIIPASTTPLLLLLLTTIAITAPIFHHMFVKLWHQENGYFALQTEILAIEPDWNLIKKIFKESKKQEFLASAENSPPIETEGDTLQQKQKEIFSRIDKLVDNIRDTHQFYDQEHPEN